MTPTPDKLGIPEAAVGPASRFRKKPVVIEAVQYEYPYMDMVAEFAGPSFPVYLGEKVDGGRELYITTLEDGIGGVAKHVASPGDWIIRGVKGEIYACKPDIFEATYEPASAHLPHMPDRGYAEEAAKLVEQSCRRMRAGEWLNPVDELMNLAAAIRALAPPAPADNGELPAAENGNPGEVYVESTNGKMWHVIGPNWSMQPVGHITAAEAKRLCELACAALSATPSPIEDVAPSELTFSDLRQANVARQQHWGGTDNWTLADWSNALAGEVGEACNVVKKIRRQELGTVGNAADLPTYHAQLESEIGDVLIYLDLLALKTGVTLEHCVSRAFNEKSEKLDMPVRLAARRVRPSPVDEDARDGVLPAWRRDEPPIEQFVLVRPIGLHSATGVPFTPTVAQSLDWSGTRRWYSPMNEIEPIEFGEGIEQEGLPEFLKFHGTEWQYLPGDDALQSQRKG